MRYLMLRKAREGALLHSEKNAQFDANKEIWHSTEWLRWVVSF